MNMDPPSLFDDQPTPTFVMYIGKARTIDEAFRLFHAANPWVYDALVRLARDMHERGRRRLGIGMLFEVLRWQWFRGTLDPSSDFKLNNNYRSRYARMIATYEPDLADIFEMRRLTAA